MNCNTTHYRANSSSVPGDPTRIAERRLANGLEVVSAETGKVPLATLALVIKGGASTDPTGKAGVANMAANLATKGTASRDAQAIAAELEALGAEISSNAGPDGLILSVSAPVANLEAAGLVLADIALNATFPEAELERDRKRALDGLSIAMKDPGALAGMVAQPVLYGGAPYGRLPTGTLASLGTLTRADLIAHRDRWWQPGNAALVVSGGIDAARASGIAERLFGGWNGNGQAAAAPVRRAGETAKVRTVVIDMPGAGQAAVVAGVRGIDRADPAYYDLLVANSVLGVGSNGRLFQEVRVKKALSYGAYSAMPARLDDSLLTATAQTKNESAPDVAQIFLTELDRLGTEPIPADTIEKRKAFITGALNRQMETGGGFGTMLAGLIQQGLPTAEAVRQAQRIAGVTPQAASGAAGRIVSADKASLVIVGDAAKFIDRLRAIRPDVEVIKADQLDLDRLGGAATVASR